MLLLYIRRTRGPASGQLVGYDVVALSYSRRGQLAVAGPHRHVPRYDVGGRGGALRVLTLSYSILLVGSSNTIAIIGK